MNESDHGHKHHKNRGKSHGARPGLHRDWRAWAVVLLMLASMFVYVFTMDESIVPDQVPAEGNPAAYLPVQ